MIFIPSLPFSLFPVPLPSASHNFIPVRVTHNFICKNMNYQKHCRKRKMERLRSSPPRISWNLDIAFPTPILLQAPTFSLMIRVNNPSQQRHSLLCLWFQWHEETNMVRWNINPPLNGIELLSLLVEAFLSWRLRYINHESLKVQV